MEGEVQNVAPGENVTPDQQIQDTPPDTPGNVPAEQPAPEAEPEWLAALPESMREAGKSAGSIEEMQEALKRGMEHAPIAKLDDVDLEGLSPDAIDIDWLKGLAVKGGFSPQQVATVKEALLTQEAEATDKLRESSETHYRKEWGGKYDERMNRLNDVCKKIDGPEYLNGKLKPFLEMGYGNHPTVIAIMDFVAEHISPSPMPGTSPGGGSAAEAMSSEAFINDIMRAQ